MHVLSVLAVATLAPVALGAPIRTYDASLDTLPTAQGWTFDGNSTTGLGVAGGVMSYGPASVAGTTYWDADLPDDAMDFATQTWSLTVDVRLTESSYGNVSGFRRGGFTVYLEDDAQNWIIADIGSSAISLRNDNNGLSDPEDTFDLTQDFHLVTLEAGPSGARLLVDGVEKLTLALGASGGSPNSAIFGDSSILAGALLTEVRGASLVPAPAVAALGAPMALAGAVRRRRSR